MIGENKTDTIMRGHTILGYTLSGGTVTPKGGHNILEIHCPGGQWLLGLDVRRTQNSRIQCPAGRVIRRTRTPVTPDCLIMSVNYPARIDFVRGPILA